MNEKTFRKMYTPEEIKAIAGGGGEAVKLYCHNISFKNTYGLVKDNNSNPLVTNIMMTLYTNDATPFNATTLGTYLSDKLNNTQPNFNVTWFNRKNASLIKSMVISLECYGGSSTIYCNVRYVSLSALETVVEVSSEIQNYFEEDKVYTI